MHAPGAEGPPAALGGSVKAITIAHISDLHAGSPYFVPSLMDRTIVELNELQPDLVLCTGDLTDDRVPPGLRDGARVPASASSAPTSS